MEFALLGLGNRTFERFCGNSVAFREALLENGAKEMIDFVQCNSASNE
jgi:sulfite reductase alpha subunit-like flavoprotein